MMKYSDTILDSHGNVLSSVSIQVNNSPAGTPATIYSDNGVTVATNPLTSETDGSFKFYATNGLYNLVLTKTGYTFDTTDTSNLTLYDPLTDTNFITKATVVGKGSLMSGSAAATPVSVNVGGDRYRVQFDSTASSGISASNPWIRNYSRF